ncbi:hypothetical protein Hanom_Chr06g00564901 [Helianthus anomalus]
MIAASATNLLPPSTVITTSLDPSFDIFVTLITYSHQTTFRTHKHLHQEK